MLVVVVVWCCCCCCCLVLLLLVLVLLLLLLLLSRANVPVPFVVGTSVRPPFMSSSALVWYCCDVPPLP